MWPFRCQRSRQDRRTGRRGEVLAATFLRRAGYRILARNYRCPAGEADLIALDPRGEEGPVLVFVEVKTRTDDRYVDPESAVDAAKRRHMNRVAEYYLSRRPAGEYPVRFDVVAVTLAHGEPARIRHIPSAF